MAKIKAPVKSKATVVMEAPVDETIEVANKTTEESTEDTTGVDEPINTEDTAQEDADTELEETEETEETEATTTTSDVKEKAPIVTMVVEPTAKAVPDQNVKIKVGKDYNCTIGGERYFFEKGKTYNVPKNVRSVLSGEANLLQPL